MGPGNHKDGSPNGANTRSRRVHPKYKNPLLQDIDVTRIPTTPHWQAMSVEQAPIWQYESPDYEVESSIPSLSLMVPEIPTHSSIEEIDTRPALPVEQASPVREEAPFYAPNRSVAQYVDVPFGGRAEEAPDKEARAKKTARLQVASALEMYRSPKIPAKRRSRGRNPLDRVRWWLLYPGRIEFVLWLCGTVLLIGVTCMLLLVTAFSFGWIAPGQQSGMALQNLANNSVNSTKPALTVIDPGPFSPGQVIRLHGQGFSIGGSIVFTFDSAALQLSQNVASGLVHQPHVNADGHGEFIVSLALGSGPAWKGGRHSIVAHDIATNHLAFLSILLVPYRATLTPVSSTRAGNQNGSVHATPVATTPPPVKSTPPPAVTPTATPTQAPPTPTPTATPSPTATATPTSAVTTNAVNGALISSSITIRAPAASFSASLVSAQDRCQAVFHQCPMFSPATRIWLFVFVYTLAMLMLVAAAILRHIFPSSLLQSF
jgi:hypothetical protein